ncbi:SusC/RagA family TonB-linked outer membrane protein [Yeosuana sp. MJ-SS3]|uniref:SusC/RagA family TonB-linked outer membrane protein n=1 Tax=Gilvirhabdus luticola TaxID=3079858 RepID=A0ABU3U4V6_9FLAO|nr:SusC/RagA family TonB-linked outer membrane protein [Yeosuana sp. MJ-SS3]MDU8885396.1 SusC/RagA family TonB-linked outer membrane protein [Yeosuana sp. MJ-SS3]
MKIKLTWLLMLFMALAIQFSYGQEKTISGTVTSSIDGLPLPGVNVIVKNTTRGVQTDFDGNYSINVSEGEVITFSFLGMQTFEATVGTSNTIDVALQEDIESLTEVVVVGFSTKARDELTSAVANVTTEDLERITPSVSIDNMLQGVASGVQVTARNGKPGNTAYIRIRGIGSINAGNEPLYIVDGATMNENDVNSINPSDVESVSILKDAASTSIYGARGGNGVVVITTKRGAKNTDAIFRINSRIGWGRKTKDNFKMMNAEQKLQYEAEMNAYGLNAGVASSITTQEEYDRYLSRDNDWRETLLQDSFIQSTAFSVTGGEEQISYYFSLGYDEESGIIRDLNGYNRLSASLNVDYDAKEWATIGTSLNFSALQNEDPRDIYNDQNPFYAAYAYNPYETLYLLDDDNNQILDDNGDPIINPTSSGYPVTSELREVLNTRYYNTTRGNIYLDLKLHDNVSWRTQASGVYQQYRRESYLKPGSTLDLIIFGGTPTGSKTDNGSFDWTYTILNKITFNKTFGEKHNVELTGLSEYIKNNFRNYSANGQGFVVGGPSVLNVAATPNAVGGTRSEYAIFSLAANLDYNYDNRYILNGTVRRDGSSRFGENTKYGVFYSGSFAWNINNEEFMESVDFVNTLKLRAAAGTSGNDQIGRYASQTTYTYVPYNGNTTLVPNNFGDPNLGWEENFNYGIGLEFGLFNNRVRGLVDYYHRTTTNLLLDEQLTIFTGDNNVTGNLGEMENSGWEFELAVDVIRKQDFRWTISGNVNLYDNELTKLTGAEPLLDDDGNPLPEELFTVFNTSTILRVGEEINTFYDVRYAGVNPANGEALYYESDGYGNPTDVVTNVNSGNQVVLSGKSPLADIDGSITTNFQYKGFDLSANFYFKAGNYIWNQAWNFDQLSDGSNSGANQRLDAFNYWRNPGDTNVLPRPNSNSHLSSDRFLEKGDYIRLRSLQVGYTLPSEFIDKLAIEGLRFYVAGTNIWTYAPYYSGDPEVGIGSLETVNNVIPGEFSLYSYPTTSSITFGIDLKF